MRVLANPWLPLVVAFVLVAIALGIVWVFAANRPRQEIQKSSTQAVMADAFIRVAATSIPAAAIVFLGQFVVASTQERARAAERHHALAEDISTRIRDLAGDLEYSTPSIHAMGFDPPSWEDERRNNHSYLKFMLRQEVARAKRFGSETLPPKFQVACDRYIDWIDHLEEYINSGELNNVTSEEMYSQAKADVLNWLANSDYDATPVESFMHWKIGEPETAQ